MVSMYMQECLQMQMAMHYMQAKFLQVALMFVLQVQAGCCSLDYIKTVAVVYIMHAHVLERHMTSMWALTLVSVTALC